MKDSFSLSLLLLAVFVIDIGHVGSFFKAEASQILNSYRREASGYKKISIHQKRIEEPEELKVPLKRVDASIHLQMTSDTSEEDLTEIGSYSRTKRGIILKKALLLKKLMAAVLTDKKLGQVEKYSGIKAGIKVGEKIGYSL